jgi:hypothetical protein
LPGAETDHFLRGVGGSADRQAVRLRLFQQPDGLEEIEDIAFLKEPLEDSGRVRREIRGVRSTAAGLGIGCVSVIVGSKDSPRRA